MVALLRVGVVGCCVVTAGGSGTAPRRHLSQQELELQALAPSELQELAPPPMLPTLAPPPVLPESQKLAPQALVPTEVANKHIESAKYAMRHIEDIEISSGNETVAPAVTVSGATLFAGAPSAPLPTTFPTALAIPAPDCSSNAFLRYTNMTAGCCRSLQLATQLHGGGVAELGQVSRADIAALCDDTCRARVKHYIAGGEPKLPPGCAEGDQCATDWTRGLFLVQLEGLYCLPAHSLEDPLGRAWLPAEWKAPDLKWCGEVLLVLGGLNQNREAAAKTMPPSPLQIAPPGGGNSSGAGAGGGANVSLAPLQQAVAEHEQQGREAERQWLDGVCAVQTGSPTCGEAAGVAYDKLQPQHGTVCQKATTSIGSILGVPSNSTGAADLLVPSAALPGPWALGTPSLLLSACCV